MKQRTLGEFTHLYPVSKTLRFELKPIGQTLDWIEQNGLLTQDEQRADNYKVVKKIIDHYHKHFIDQSLRSLQGEEREKFNKCLDDYLELRGKTDATLKKKLEKVQDSLRKIITDLFDTSRLFGKELIKEDLIIYLYECERNGEQLPAELNIDECIDTVKDFGDFTTYFTGFHENRKNMYSPEAKATAIAYRLIHENLPKFANNMAVWCQVKAVLADKLSQLDSTMQTEFGCKPLSSYFEDYTMFAECLTQGDIIRYNTIIGGLSEGDVKIQGINEYINLYNQQVDKKARLPKMTELYKMILSDRGSTSWLPSKFDSDQDLLDQVREAYLNVHDYVFEGVGQHPSLKDLMASLSDFQLGGIYIKNDATLTSVIKQSYGDWDALNKGLERSFYANNPQGKKSDDKYREATKKWINSFDSFSIDDICHYTGQDNVVKWYEGLWSDKEMTAFERVEDAYRTAKDLLNTEYQGNLKEDEQSVESLKSLLDALKDLQRLAHTLKGNGDESGRDGAFYAEWDRLTETLNTVTPLYNMVRNYVTQKAYSEEKFKLNFNSPQLMSGWDQNKESDCLGILLRKEGLYYLGIMEKHHNKIFSKDLPSDGPCYEKVDYKFFKDLTTMVPKCTTQLKVVKTHFLTSNDDFTLTSDAFVKPITITKEIFELNNVLYQGKKKFQKEYLTITHDEVGYNHAVSVWINFCLDFLDSYKSTTVYDISAIRKTHFSQLDTFYTEINKLLYKLSFRPVSESYINSLVSEGSLYLFQIYNKDFSQFSKGTPNMHTLYWKALFSEENLRDVIYKLNGDAEIFFRRKSVFYDEKHQKEGYHYEKLKDKFSYPIYKDYRYSVDKFQFHVPITMNFKSSGREFINQHVCEFIKAGGVKHIIGIDRGERHLLYLSMIDLEGNIVKQFTLNTIKNEYKEIDYHTLLDKKEDDRDKARKNWQTIDGIKDLKEGYLSQVVHIISQMMVEYNAIVVLEDLNFGFMRGRQKVEKQVYQKFEKALIDKLNYLVDKKKPIDEVGGLLHALQLTSKFDSFQKLGKQSGFLFYVPANLTSKIDPVTGFANYINTKYENREKAVELLGKFADIHYNAEQDYFEFEIDDYKKFNTKAVGRKNWTLCSYGTRIKTYRNPQKNNEWDNAELDITNELKRLFSAYDIDYSVNLIAQILIQKEKRFFSNVDGWCKENDCLGILDLLGLILQMRNSITGTETDYIISPVADETGNFYNSDKGVEILPKDADANGAYNIARKGLWAVMQMQQADDPTKVSLAISNAEWMQFAQEKPYKK